MQATDPLTWQPSISHFFKKKLFTKPLQNILCLVYLIRYKHTIHLHFFFRGKMETSLCCFYTTSQMVWMKNIWIFFFTLTFVRENILHSGRQATRSCPCQHTLSILVNISSGVHQLCSWRTLGEKQLKANYTGSVFVGSLGGLFLERFQLN